MVVVLFLLLVVAVLFAWILMLVRDQKKIRRELFKANTTNAQIRGELGQTSVFIGGLQAQLSEQERRHGKALEERSKRAVSAARGSINGQVAEHAFPMAPEHDYHPKDVFHLGGIVDYVVFDGLHEIREGARDPEGLTVVMVDVKFGSSRMTTEQQAVMTALNAGRTRGEVWQARTSEGALTYTRKDRRS